MGSVGDSFDNALAESVNSSYKTELTDHQPLYPGATELSLATAEWVAFYKPPAAQRILPGPHAGPS